MKFIVYLALAHQRRAPAIAADMRERGGYICHLDATCEGRDTFLMSSIDSLSDIVLGNVKLPAEDEAHIVPFLERIKNDFGVPLALVHDMGILKLTTLQMRGKWRDNTPYFRIHNALKPIMQDKTLWKAVEALESKIIVFEKLRNAMRIAQPTDSRGLNDEGHTGHIRTIEKRVRAFRTWLTGCPDYPGSATAHKMIGQIDKYWQKLFADPIQTQTPSGSVLIQP